MNKLYFFLILVFGTFGADANSSQIEGESYNKLIVGEWVLSKIEAPDKISILAKEDVPVSSNQGKTIIDKENIITIPLEDFLKRQLTVGLTKIIFTTNDVVYQKNPKSSIKGEWQVVESTLKIAFNDGANQKMSKIVSLNNQILVLESESQNKPVKFYYTRVK